MFVCLCVCVWERVRSSCGFVFQNAPQSTAVQKDEAPKHELYYVSHNAVQGSRCYTLMQRWKREESSWFECFPRGLLFSFRVPLSLNLLCPKREKETVLSLSVESFTVTFWDPQLHLSVSVQEKEKLQQISPQSEREKVREGREVRCERVQVKISKTDM